MIEYPFLKEQPSSRQVIDTFKGYNHNLRIGSGEFYEMKNMTSDDYPVLSPRRKRGLLAQLTRGCSGMLYVPERGLFYLEDTGPNSVLCLLTPEGITSDIIRLNPNSKRFALMGKRLIIAPEMRWVDIDTLGSGYIEETWPVKEGEIAVELCDVDGNVYQNVTASVEPPSNPGYHELWLNVAVGQVGLKQYEPATSEWISISATYLKISGLGDHNFNTHDGVEISGLVGSATALNGSYIIEKSSHGCIVVAGVIYDLHTQDCAQAPVVIERKAPKLDFVVETGNRLWGCIKDKNEIYACKLGDIFNWNCFMGLSTDSWVGSIGTPGEFTGAVVQNGYPVFYKETYKHKVWPSTTGAHQITSTPCNGVEKGSENSLAVLDGTVFYKSSFGVCADDGGGAVQIGRPLGDANYHSAFGAAHDGKYYLGMADDAGRHLFIYDISRKLWHKEDNSLVDHLASGIGCLYAASENELWDLTGKQGTPEDVVSWMVETGDLGLELPEQKYISRLTLRLMLEPGAKLEVFAMYDQEPVWIRLGTVYGTNLRSFSLPVRPRRCDQLRLKLQGIGICNIYSITKTLEKGSELP